MTEMKAVKLVTDILRGFTELIQLGVIHRDLKPANILVHNGSYKIAGINTIYTHRLWILKDS